ncbi:MAG: FHA domain-containing protein [Verrucomicrobiota bacterium]
MEPVSLKSAHHFDVGSAQTQIISSSANKQINKETIAFKTPAATSTVYIKLPKKLSLEMNVLMNCCLIIGRAPDPPENKVQYSLLALDSVQISRTHVAIFKEKNTLFIQDMNSTNGTYLNVDGARYKLEPFTPTKLSDQSVVEFGEAVMNIKPSRMS